MILDPNVLAEVVTPENAMERARELDIAPRALLQNKREVAVEKQRMVAQQAQLDEQENRIRQNVSTQQTQGPHGRYHPRMPLAGENLDPTNLFITLQDQPIRAAQGAQVQGTGAGRTGGAGIAGPSMVPAGSPHMPSRRARGNEGTAPPSSRFHTPPGQFNNPMDNVYATTLALDRIPEGNSPREVETRQAVEMMRTAVVQHANYLDNISGMHRTPYNSQSKSRQGKSPRNIQSTSEQRRAELERQQMPPPPLAA